MVELVGLGLTTMLDIRLGGVSRRGKYSPLGGEIYSKEDKRIVPVPGSSNNSRSGGLYDIGKDR